MDPLIESLRRAQRADPEDPHLKRRASAYSVRAGETQHWAILSQVNGNLEALEAVLDDIQRRGISQCVVLGNHLGYGANPIECWRRLKKQRAHCLRGHHEALLGSEQLQLYNSSMRAAIRWNYEQLRAAPSLLEEFRATPEILNSDGLTFAFGSPSKPSKEFIVPADISDSQRPRLERFFNNFEQLLFTGSFAYPFAIKPTGRLFFPYDTNGQHSWNRGGKLIVNVGSVGTTRRLGLAQPVGYPPCYVEYYETEIRWHLVDYNAETARQKARLIEDLGEHSANTLTQALSEPTHQPIWT